MRLLIVMLLIFAAGCASLGIQKNEPSTLRRASESGALTACTSDNDCVSVKGSCCGCNMGGSNMAINREFLSEWESQFGNKCDGVMCLAVVRPPCPGKAKCVLNSCVLRG
jgi:hypothetical protein